MERSKKPELLHLARILSDAALPYAVIGGVTLQVHPAEPRTTLDIDVAVSDLSALPRSRLEAVGFRAVGRFPHSENWMGPDATPLQFTDDPALADAIARAEEVPLEGVRLRVLRRADLLHQKLRAGSNPALRRSRRLQDLADAQALMESDPALASELSAEERALLDRLPQ